MAEGDAVKMFSAHTFTGATSNGVERTRGWERLRDEDEARSVWLDVECRRLKELEHRERQARARAAGRVSAAKRRRRP